jgi:phosphohistidine swiveling domain-containing protein
MERLVPLGSAEAVDAGAVGAKAARLSLAVAAGLPVLPGWALPVAASADAVHVGVEALERRGGAAATLALSALPLDGALVRDLDRVEHREARTSVVRTSTPADDDGRWAGAFATYHDVEPELVPVAVRGCWASMFSPDVLARRRRLSGPVAALGVGVVIQPWLAFAFGGTATCLPDGGVAVTAAAGGPAGIVGGLGSGDRIEVAAGQDGVGPRQFPDPRVVPAAAALSRDTAAATGHDAIEWGWADGRVLLLQAGTTPRPPEPAASRAPGFSPGPRLRALARTVARYRAPLGDELVVPWALVGGEPPPPSPVLVGDPSSALTEASVLAARLTADAWFRPSDLALRATSDVSRVLLGSEPDRAVARMPPIHAVDREAAARLLGLVEGLGVTLASRRLLADPDLVWRLSVTELRAVLEGRAAAPSRSGPDRWEPFVFRVVAGARPAALGTRAAPGIGAGPLHAVSSSTPSSMPPPRAVIAARSPLPQLAPLLFGSAAVVTAGGSTGAHLFEVARSLGIPAVVGVDLTAVAGAPLVAVDGDRAEVSVLEGSRVSVAAPIGGK